jgi:hypothetical protein
LIQAMVEAETQLEDSANREIPSKLLLMHSTAG